MRLKEVISIFLLSLFLLPLAAGGGLKDNTFVVPPWNHCLGLHKVTQFHLDIYSGYREKFDDPQGLFCTKLKCKDDPDNPKDDDELTVYGLNSGRNEIIYNKSLTSIGIVGGPGRGLKEFNHPVSLTGDSDGNLYVADTGNNRVVHLRYENDELVGVKEITLDDTSLPLNHPTGVSLSGGRLYVADRDNDRIVVLSPDGKVLADYRFSIGGDRLFKPYTIAAVSENDKWRYYRDYFLAVVDSLGRRLWKIAIDGSPLKVVHYGSILHGGSFNHVAIDYYGNIYVTDTEMGVIHKFDRHLNYIVSIGDSQFDEPRGITIYRRFGQIFISEREGAQYYWIGTDVKRFKAENLVFDTEKQRGSIDVSFLLTEHSNISLKLVCKDSDLELPIIDDYLLPPGFISRRISFRVDIGDDIANCKFRVVLRAKPTYSSVAYHSVTSESRTLIPVIK